MNADAVTIEVPGATAAEILRGVAAAMAVFDAADATPYEAAEADFIREGLYDGGYYDEQGNFADWHEDEPIDDHEVRLKPLTERQARVASLCREADCAAVDACCAEWPDEKRRLFTARLSLGRDDVSSLPQSA